MLSERRSGRGVLNFGRPWTLRSSASRLGDYFTGSSRGRLWIDDVELVY